MGLVVIIVAAFTILVVAVVVTKLREYWRRADQARAHPHPPDQPRRLTVVDPGPRPRARRPLYSFAGAVPL
jgi:hypothetical protein